MKTDVHLLCFNEAEILPYTLRHYRTFADRIIVHDGFSTDRSRDIAASFGAEVADWDTGGKLNDKLAMELKNTCWLGTTADWVICADADELIYFPEGAEKTLREYDEFEVSLVKPHGWEMCSDVFPTGDGQLYDYVKMGAKEERWYSKPILFSPKRVASVQFSPGAHQVKARYHDGKLIPHPVNYSYPATYLLHCKHLGPVERIAARYDAVRKRLAPVNEKHRWGNFEPGLKHAQDKRDAILPRLEQVIP
jgi:glycosyltransferase involved in cell wall biosynthesis